MAKAAKPIPEGYHTLTTHMIVKNAERAIDFYKRAFGATELYRMKSPDGKRIMHAELKIGNSPFMLSDESEQHECKEGHICKSAETLHGSPIGFYIYVDNVDTSFKNALGAGGKETEALSEMFWGDRCGTLLDPFGFQWTIATRKEDLSSQEIEQKAKEFYSKKKVA